MVTTNRERASFWSAVATMVVGGVGIGMFGLPYVFGQAGGIVGMAYLVVLAVVNVVALAGFADLLAGTSGHLRLAGVVERYLGREMGLFMEVLTFMAGWGAMLVYVLVGGEFAHALLAPVIGGGLVVYQMGFFVAGSVVMLGGLGMVGKMETWLAIVLGLLLVVLLGGSLPEFELANMAQVTGSHWFAPFGVVLFAVGGMSAIPEMADLLGNYRKRLARAVIVGSGIIAIIYALFALIVLGATGEVTTESAVIGLANVVGGWALLIGGLTVIVASYTSYILIGISMVESLVFDYRWRFLRALGTVIMVPLVIFWLGARSFIDVMNIVGIFIFGTTGLVVIWTYLKTKRDAWLPKRHFHYPSWALYLAGAVYVFGMMLGIVDLFLR